MNAEGPDPGRSNRNEAGAEPRQRSLRGLFRRGGTSMDKDLRRVVLLLLGVIAAILAVLLAVHLAMRVPA